jgi:hypothetical protein
MSSELKTDESLRVLDNRYITDTLTTTPTAAVPTNERYKLELGNWTLQIYSSFMFLILIYLGTSLGAILNVNPTSTFIQ